MTDALAILGGYLLGSLPFGYWVPRLVRGEDIRTKGSGNVGASNVFRVYGRSLGLPVALLDIAKGFAPAVLGCWSAERSSVSSRLRLRWPATRGPCSCGSRRAGRWPPRPGARRLALAPLVAVLCVAIWLVVFALTRFASVATIVTAIALGVLVIVLGYPWPIVAFGVGGAVAVIALHHQNIRRLVAGTEHRFELRRPRRASG